MSGRPTGWEAAERWFRRPPGGGGGEGGQEPPPPEEPPGARCEVCDAPLEPDQTYCLECGTPTPLAPRLSRPRAAAMLAAGMAVLGVGAGILAFVLANDDGGGRAATSPTTATDTAFVPTIPPPDTSGTGPLPPDTSIVPPTATAPPTDTGGLPTDTGGFPTVTGPDPAPPPEPEPEPEPGPAPAPSDWPAGRTAWTAILSSVRSEGAAQAAKRRVRDAGEPAGVLLSSDHPGMRPGFYVVFSGVFDDRSRAIAQATRLRPSWPGAYARRVSG